MKRIAIIILSLTFCFLSQAQTGWEKPVQFFTPNAASLGTYGQVPVNYFNGLAQVSIPLTSFKVNGYELPISLSYYGGGNKPDSHPGWVGLGWNLFAGGSINRIVNGIKDETTRSEVNYLYPSNLNWSDFPGYYYRMDSLNRPDWSSSNYLKYLLLERATNSILLQKRAYVLDTEPDEFQVNVGDISASFYLMSNNTVKIKSKSNSNFKIHINLGAFNETADNYFIIGSFQTTDQLPAKCFTYIKEIILTNNDGIKYYFGGDQNAIEFSFAKCNSRDLMASANTWHLKKIVLPNGETIELDYEKKGIPIIENNNRYVNTYIETNRPTTDSSNAVLGHRAYTLIQPSYLKSIHSPISGRTMSFKRSKSTELGYNIDPYFFNQIFGNDQTSKLYAYKEILLSDSSNYYMQLDSIIDTNKKIALNYTSSPDTRLKLDNIVFSDSKNSRINGYLFDYNSTELPYYNSKKNDNWGYYNNKYYGEIPYANLYDFRAADSTYMKAEMLMKITYPTGGTTEFVYEPHDYSKIAIPAVQNVSGLNYINTSRMCGGLRIKKMINRDTNNHTTIREFEYKNEEENSSGILSGIPIYTAAGAEVINFGYDIKYKLCTFNGDYTLYYSFGNEQCQNQLANTNGNHITYSRVTEKLSDGSNTIYNYTNHEKFNDIGSDLTAGGLIYNFLPCNRFISYELERGLLESVEYYKNTMPVKKEVYTYNSDPNRYNDFVKSINIYGYTDVIRAIPLKTFTFCPYLQSKTETTYDVNGINPVSSTTNYRYNSYRLPSFVSQSGSRSASDSTAVVTKYPFDNNGSPYSTMTQKFMLNYPIETIKYKGNSITDGKLTTYKELIVANDSLYVPDKVFSTEITSPLASFSNFDGTTKDSHYGVFPEMEFLNYGPKGNIYEIKDRKGISTAFLWSYSYQHPIAEIKNATYQQIGTELGSSYLSNLTNNPNPSTSDLTNLNSLRTSPNLPGIEVNTFTYKPFVGMTSKTDPRGVSTNYTYDTFDRLFLSQDDNSNILARYRYAYHDNGPGYVISASLKPAPFYVQDVTDTLFVFESAKGSGNYSYNWSLLKKDTVLASGNSNSNRFNITCSKTGELTLKCTVTDNVTGRKIEKEKSFMCYSKPTLKVTSDLYYMINSPGSATASATGGSGDFKYEWAFADDSGYTQGTGTLFNFTSSYSGNKALVCNVTDNLTKQAQNVTMLIPFYTSPTVTINTGLGWCMMNGADTVSISAGSGGSTRYRYSWSLNGGTPTNTTSPSYSFTCPTAGEQTIICNVTDSVTGQTATDTKKVMCYNVPTASVSILPAYYMLGAQGIATVTPGSGSTHYRYSWSLNGGTATNTTSASYSFTCSTPGTQTIQCIVTDSVTGRTATSSQTVKCYTYPSASVTILPAYYMLGAQGSATVTPGDGSTHYSYSWSLNGGTATNTTSATYSFTCSTPGTQTIQCIVTDSVTGRTATGMQTVKCYSVPTASVAMGASYYMLGATGSATVTPGSGSTNYSYSWMLNGAVVTGTSATLSFTCSTAGVQTVKCTVTDNVTVQTATDTKTVTSYTYPTAVVSTGATWYMLNGAGTATVDAGGGSGSYSCSWKLKNSSGTVLQNGTNSSSFSYTCSQSGTLTVECTVTDALTGQTVTNSKTVTCYTSPTAIVSTGASWYMMNGAGTATVSAGNGSGNYSNYAWKLKNSSGTVLQTGTNSTTFSYTCSQSGTLTVECAVTDAVTGQTVTDSKTISSYTVPTASVSTGATWYMVNGAGTGSVSAGGGSGNYSYSWKLKNSGGTVLQNGTNSSSFSYTCSQSGTLTVECTVTDNVTGQTVTDSKTITSYTYPTAVVSTGATWYMMNGTGTGSVSAGGGSGSYSYSWKLKNSGGTVLQTGTNSTSFSYTCSQSGTLTVECTVTDAVTGQTVTNSKNITSYTYPTAVVSTGATWYMINGAGTASVSAGAGSGSYSYSWKLKNSGGTVLQTGTNSTSFSYTCSQSGTLTAECTVTDAVTGQAVTNSKNVTSYTYPAASVTVGSTWLIINGGGTANVSGSGGSGNYSYAWRLKNSGGTVLQTGDNSASFYYTCPQSGTITVECTVTDNVTAQTATDSKTFTCYTYPTASVTTGASSYMLNGAGTASVSAGAGSGGYSYAWKLKNSGGTVLQNGTNAATFSYTCSQSGTLTVECTVTDNMTGQSTTQSTPITIYTYPTASVSTGASWYMINNPGTATVSTGGGSVNYTYTWRLKNSSGTVLQTGTNNPSFTYTCSQAGTLTVECTVTDNVTGQTVTDSKTINSYTVPTASVSTGATWYMVNGTGTGSVSAGGGSGNYSYSWKLKNSGSTVLQTGTNSSSFSYTCSQAGTLTVECTVTDNVTGQTVTNSKNITSYTYPTSSVSTGASWYMINGGGSASVSGSNGSGSYSYAWKLKYSDGTVLQNGTNSTSFSYTCSQAGTLTVESTVTDAVTGQTVTNTKTVTSYTYPAAGVTSGSTWIIINGGGTANASGSGGSGNYSYAWRLKNSGGTVLQTGTNAASFYYTCPQSGTITVECTVSDNVTAQTATNSKAFTSYTYPTASVSIGSSSYVLNATGTASVSAGAGSGSYSYSWKLKNSGGTVLQTGTNSTSFSYTCSQLGTLTVECTVTDAVTGQTGIDSKTVSVYNPLTSTVSTGANWYMLNSIGSATVTPGGGSGNYSYSWFINGTAVTGTTATLSFTCSSAGTYSVVCIVTDNVNGQTVTGNKTVSCYTAPTASVSTGASSYTQNDTGSATVSASGGSGSYSYAWSLLNGSTVLSNGSNSSSFSFTCSQTGTLTVRCIVTDNVTGQTKTATQNISCTAAITYGNFTLQSGYSNYYNSLSKSGTSVSFVLSFGLSNSSMNSGWSYYVATIPTGFKPTSARTVTINSYGATWNLTFNSNGTVYCQIVSGPDFPMGSGVNLSGSYNL